MGASRSQPWFERRMHNVMACCDPAIVSESKFHRLDKGDPCPGYYSLGARAGIQYHRVPLGTVRIMRRLS